MSLKVVDVSKILLESLIPFMEKHGFRLNKRNKEFNREIGDTKQILDLFFYKKADHITIKPEVRIKVKSIDTVYRSITDMENRPYYTLGNHLFEIVRYMDTGNETERGELSNWLVEDEGDVWQLVEVIPKYFEESILPYFEENSSLARVDELLNKSPRDMSIHNWLYPLRANVALIAAKLNDNPKYDELVTIYDEETQEAEESYREEFIKLKEVLAQAS